jgi:hypothetical protein
VHNCIQHRLKRKLLSATNFETSLKIAIFPSQVATVDHPKNQFQFQYICMIAQDVEHACERIFDVAVQMDWIGADIKIKKLLLIFMSNLNCPVIKFNLLEIVDVNLKTFVQVRLKLLTSHN